MSDVTIKVRKNGPLLVTGEFSLTDADGNSFPIDTTKPGIALCRCGASANHPFCDGSHNACGFDSEVKAPTKE